LKRLNLSANGKIDPGHNYKRLFCDLPSEQQRRIIEAAKVRMGPHADYSDMPRLLELYSRNFIRLRYPYEAYEGISEEEYLTMGVEWIKAGSPIDDAMFQYFPDELTGLLYALQQEQ